MQSSSIKSILKLSAEPDSALSDWEDFSAAYNKAKGESVSAALLNSYPGLLKIFGNSRFLSRFLIQHPERLSPLPPLPTAAIDELRLYKYQALLHLTMADLNGESQESIFTKISQLALTILQQVDSLSFNETVKKWGSPVQKNGDRCAHHILALGKLGGHELNYSSDIDLIPFYETDDGQAGSITLHEFFVKHLQNLTKKLVERDENGFLYRTDWDLRPEGRAGTLTNSLLAMEEYYENFGRNWERQALAKANLGSGDTQLGQTFLKNITPFIFKRHIDLSTLTDMKDMKRRIHEEHVRSLKDAFHVKLGVGGIREIEFIAQSQLMLFGGKNPEIRFKSTLPLLRALAAHNVMSKGDTLKLEEAYLFLRKLEHRLQLVEEEQTHLLKMDDKTMLQTARRMGFEGSDDEAYSTFNKELKRHTHLTNTLFEELFGTVNEAPQTLYQTESTPGKKAAYALSLHAYLREAPDYEFLLDSIRYFKKNEVKKIEGQENTSSRRDILGSLSVLAEAISEEAMKIALYMMEARFGKPCFKNDKGELFPAEITALAMGKFGGREINYSSDLDMIFIYSENGTTTGENSIANSEFFARVIQKFITTLSVQTRAGTGYEIDTELRPSGHAGTLVTSLASFMEYQRQASQIWEKQALLRARPLFGSGRLANLLTGNLRAILYSQAYDPSIKEEMDRLRMRVEKEIARESDTIINFKSGLGGIMDIEFIVQYLQLTQGALYNSLQTTNTFEVLDEIKLLGLLSDYKVRHLTQAYTFYRTLESKISFVLKRSEHQLKKNGELLNALAPQIGLVNGIDLWAKILEHREQVRKIYKKVLV
ncbi:hypothetical protein K1X76_04125 [bacterium]|nr:hypothetical protein [bacterium]